MMREITPETADATRYRLHATARFYYFPDTHVPSGDAADCQGRTTPPAHRRRAPFHARRFFFFFFFRSFFTPFLRDVGANPQSVKAQRRWCERECESSVASAQCLCASRLMLRSGGACGEAGAGADEFKERVQAVPHYLPPDNRLLFRHPPGFCLAAAAAAAHAA